MKHDMPKRFIESNKVDKGKFPRSTKKLRKMNDEGESVQVMSMTRVHRLANKFGLPHHEYDMAVMRRFLLQRRGRPWNEVYSEICAEADARSYSGHQLRQWLEYLVERNCTLKDEKIHDERGREVLRWGSRTFYVHPETQILEYIEQKRTHYSFECQTIFEVNGKLYHKHNDGLWYRVVMEQVPWIKHPVAYWHYNYDKVIDAFGTCGSGFYWRNARDSFLKKYGRSPKGKEWYCVKKESANHREIAKVKKQYGLT